MSEKESKFKLEQVHPWSKMFDTRYKGFSQWLVRNEDHQIKGHFKGQGAKLKAQKFINDQEGIDDLEHIDSDEPVYWVSNKESEEQRLMKRSECIALLGEKDFKKACCDLIEDFEIIRL